MTKTLPDRDRHPVPLHRGHLLWRLLDRTQLHARVASQLAEVFVELGCFALQSGRAGMSTGLTYVRAARHYLAAAAQAYYAHISLCAAIPSPPASRPNSRDRARARSERLHHQRLRWAGVGSVLLHGWVLGLWAIATYLSQPPLPEAEFIPFEFVELPPEILEAPEPSPEESFEEALPPEPEAKADPPPTQTIVEPILQAPAPPPARVALPPVAAPPPPPSAAPPPPERVAIAPPPAPEAIEAPPPPQREVVPEPPPSARRELEQTTVSERAIALSTPPPIPTPTPIPQLKPLLESFRTEEPPQLLELPARSPNPDPIAQTAPPVDPTASDPVTSTTQLDPLLESFRTDAPPKLLELPTRELVPDTVTREDSPLESQPLAPPAPVKSSAPQLEPLLESFRMEEPPQLLELPARSPVPISKPEIAPIQTETSPVAEPAPTRRPPPPLAVLSSMPPVSAPIKSLGESSQTEIDSTEPEAIAPAPPAPEPQAAMSGSTAVARPIPGRQRQPAYPERARRRNQEGRVTVRARVDESGQVVQVEVTNSSGHPSLDEAAANAVERWQFTPARRGEDAIASWVNVPIDFSLQ